MILTNTLINSAIAKAYCCVAKKIVRYISLLVVGKNNKCDFKDVKLLNKYIDILQNYEIAGDKTTCVCGVNGDYTVLLNELTEFSEAKIQFNCDNTGGMFFDNQQFPFTYVYSEVSNALVIRFDNLFSNPPTDTENTILTLQGLVFEQDCTFEPNTVSPIEVAEVIVTGTPVTVNYVNPFDVQVFNWDGELFVTDETLIPVTQNIPAENLDSPTTIVTDWNTEHHPTNNGWLLNYSSATTTYTMLTPFDGVDYAPSYAAIFQQYEGGDDSFATGLTPFDQPWVTENTPASTTIEIPINSFRGSQVSTTFLANDITEPFNIEYTQASTFIHIPEDQFNNPGNKPYTTIVINDSVLADFTWFYSAIPGGVWTLVASSTNPFIDIESFIDYYNLNSTFIFTLVSSIDGDYTIEIEAPTVGTQYNNTLAIISTTTQTIINSFLNTGVEPSTNSLIDVSLDVLGVPTTIYNTITNTFTNVGDFILDFNNNNTENLIAEIPGGVYTSPNVTVKISSPVDNCWIFNNRNVYYNFNSSAYTSSGELLNGSDATKGNFTINFFPSIGSAVSSGNINFLSIDNLITNFNTNPLNVYGPSNQFKFILSYDESLNIFNITSDPDDLEGSTYNGYVFNYSYNYVSTQYSDISTSDSQPFSGGIDAISPDINLYDNFFNPIWSQAQNTYDYSNVQDFVNTFNEDGNEGYTAEITNSFIVPEILATATSNAITSFLPTDIIYAIVNNQYISSGYTVQVGDTASVVTNGIFNNITGFSGTKAIIGTNQIRLTAPTNSGASYNNIIFRLDKYSYVPATAQITITSSGNDKDSISLQAWFTDFGLLSLPIFCDAVTIALLYKNLINSGTNVHGCKASVVGAVITVTSPITQGASYNGNLLQSFSTTITTNGPSTFSGGSTTLTLITNTTFQGGVDAYGIDVVTFTAPATTGWIYNTTPLNLDIGTGDWLDSNNYSGGIDTTQGKFKVSLLDPTSALFVVLYEDLTSVNYPSIEAIMDAFNDSETNYGFVFSFGNFIILFKFQSPIASFDYYDTYSVVLEYNYDSPQYTSFISPEIYFSGGELPTLQTYSGTFENGNIGPFITDNPCTPTTIGESCLTNENVINIINHINKLCNC